MTGRLTALRSRDFRLLVGGQIVSLTGSQMQLVGVTWLLYRLTGSPIALGMIGLCRAIPTVLFALGGGVVADAVDRRRLMLVSQSLMMLSSLSLATMTALGHVSPLLIYCVIAANGAASAIDGPARQGLVPALVPREDLPNALSTYTMGWEIAAIGGPAIGGLVLARFGVSAVFFCDVASFVAVIAALLAMRHRAPPRNEARISLAAAVEGLRFLRATPLIFATMVLDFIATFFAGAMLLMPLYADRILHVGPRGLGLLFAAPPVGAALTAAALSLMPPIHHQGRALIASVVAYGLSIALFGMSPWFVASLVLLAISGAADTVSMVVRQTLRQMLTPDSLRGRMTSLTMIFFIGGPQLGEFEAGVVAKAFSPRISVASGGVLCVLAAVATAIAMPRLVAITKADYKEDQRAPASEPT